MEALDSQGPQQDYSIGKWKILWFDPSIITNTRKGDKNAVE
jgi:hypothetical protein